MQKEIVNALQWRYAVQVFDKTKKVSDADLKTILEAGRLSPSSYGLEMWQFIVVENPDVRKKMRVSGYDQPKITDASHLIVIAYRTDAAEKAASERIARTSKITGAPEASLKDFRGMLDGAITMWSKMGALESWIKAQAYIPLGTMMEAASLLKIDNAAMEGFDANAIDEILGLKAKNLHTTTMLALGYRGDDETAKRPKVRRPFEEVVTFVK